MPDNPTILIIFTTAFVIGFSGAMAPGPLLAYTITATARYGFWAGPLIVLGHAILELSLITLLVLGLDRFINSDSVTSTVGLAGGTVLVIMGFLMARQGWRKTTLPLESPAGIAQNRRVILAGIIVSMSNPYWFIWWATVGVLYLVWSRQLGTPGIISFFTGHILSDLAWYALVSFIIATGRKIINDNVYSWLLFFCGLALIGLGAYFMASGISFMLN